MQATDPARSGLIGRLIAGSARAPLLTILLVLALGAWAFVSLRDTRLDAIPDLSDTQVIVFTEWMGRSPDLVEDQVTYPIVSSLLAAPRVEAVRGQSMFGMSFIYVIFKEGTERSHTRTLRKGERAMPKISVEPGDSLSRRTRDAAEMDRTRGRTNVRHAIRRALRRG